MAIDDAASGPDSFTIGTKTYHKVPNSDPPVYELASSAEIQSNFWKDVTVPNDDATKVWPILQSLYEILRIKGRDEGMSNQEEGGQLELLKSAAAGDFTDSISSSSGKGISLDYYYDKNNWYGRGANIRYLRIHNNLSTGHHILYDQTTDTGGLFLAKSTTGVQWEITELGGGTGGGSGAFHAFSSAGIKTEGSHTLDYPAEWTHGIPDKVFVSTRYPFNDGTSHQWFQVASFNETSVTVYAQSQNFSTFTAVYADVLLVKNGNAAPFTGISSVDVIDGGTGWLYGLDTGPDQPYRTNDGVTFRIILIINQPSTGATAEANLSVIDGVIQDNVEILDAGTGFDSSVPISNSDLIFHMQYKTIYAVDYVTAPDLWRDFENEELMTGTTPTLSINF